ncbi:ABC transporter ATP-binding protein [Actinomyces capricornis]|uniref:ABC transporter ATP-binding protein n=2 Tax=Actinomyces capricornis TaxID=2755559 RepID=A0ABM7U944_9ACTO|nr:ABC transporter ATP-binding protein [Actinomyces capricornis]
MLHMTIVLDSLGLRAGGRTLLDGVSLSLVPGGRTALVGASGAGKSLTCAALAGTLPPGLEASGSLRVVEDAARDGAQDEGAPEAPAGPDLLGTPAAARPRGSRAALVPQDPTTALHPLIPALRQVELAARGAGGSRAGERARDRAVELLEAVGLDAGTGARVPGRLSGGQRQRVCLALALAGDPAVLIADEPTTALDVVARGEALALLRDVTGGPQSPSLLLITHDLPAATICQEIVVLHQGRVVDRGATTKVLTDPRHPATRAMCEAAADETLDGALAAAGLRVRGGGSGSGGGGGGAGSGESGHRRRPGIAA